MIAGIPAILLAAGESRRMGRPKLVLPWGTTTVLGQAAQTFAAAGIPEIVIVTGGARAEVEALAAELAGRLPVRTIFNPGYAAGGMLGSIQCGLRALGPGCRAALVGLGDQPQVRVEIVRRICAAFLQNGKPLVVPSFEGRRGHPWLAARPLWDEILALPEAATARQFIAAHAGEVEYVPADASVLQDLDTPEDYAGHP
jgi:molybdenum cofactor cytidylyltransferase